MHTPTNNEEAEDPYIRSLPPGYKFIPDDVDLINYYLKRKLAGLLTNPPRIKDIEVYKHSPQVLEKFHKFKGEKEMYFFTRRTKKYKEGSRPDRDVEDDKRHYGFWKATGKENPVMNNDIEIGFKRTLVFYQGKQGKPKPKIPKQQNPNEGVMKTNLKSNWIMQEYRIKDLTSSSATLPNMDDWVLCKIYEHQYGLKKSQSEGQNNKQITISTNVFVPPQSQPNHYRQKNLTVDNIDYIFKKSSGQYSQAQRVSENVTPQHQPIQDSLSVDAVYNLQYLSGQHSPAQQVPENVTPQHQSNQQYQPTQYSSVYNLQYLSGEQYTQDQQMQDSLSVDTFVVPQDQLNQHFPSTHMMYISQCQSEQYFDQAQQIQSSLSPNMVVMPQNESNQHSQLQPTNMIDYMPQDQPNQHSHSPQMNEDVNDPRASVNFDVDSFINYYDDKA